jgi:hypothetical protein
MSGPPLVPKEVEFMNDQFHLINETVTIRAIVQALILA